MPLLCCSFVQLCDAAQYEDAALLAARAPRGVLRNCDTMKLFEGELHTHTHTEHLWIFHTSLLLPSGVAGPPGSLPPSLLFFWALLITAPPSDKLSAPLSLRGVRQALQHGALQLVTHAVTQNK